MMCFNLCNSLPETLFFRDKVSLRVSMIFEEKNPKYKILIFFFFLLVWNLLVFKILMRNFQILYIKSCICRH